MLAIRTDDSVCDPTRAIVIVCAARELFFCFPRSHARTRASQVQSLWPANEIVVSRQDEAGPQEQEERQEDTSDSH